MYYEDLTPYRDGGSEVEGMINVYPKILSIGWLDAEHSYKRGDVPERLVKKLMELAFFDQMNLENQRAGKFDEDRAVVINMLHMRGSPHSCPFCKAEASIIKIRPDGLNYYRGEHDVVLGLSEMCIPAKEKGYYYSFPTLLYHYVAEHEYCPPDEFLESLEAFDLDKPFNIDNEFEDVECILVPEK